ncbi:MAG: cupin domain-containing protein [Gammaproteobacteria bacterium]|jgi:uncharacterized cupin superfamily protein|nr:cupin domain-containing protein [Gammaproteobacteria bacterium]
MNNTPRRHPNVVNIAEIEARGFTRGSRFALQTRPLGRATGARAIGCSLYEVPPGRAAFPNHYHCANEESIYVLEGTGTLQVGQERIDVGAGDYATFPTGPEHTHQLINTGNAPLRYLCFSTMLPTEVVGYPDSKKVGAFGSPGGGQPQWLRVMVREGTLLDYYDGEL